MTGDCGGGGGQDCFAKASGVWTAAGSSGRLPRLAAQQYEQAAPSLKPVSPPLPPCRPSLKPPPSVPPRTTPSASAAPSRTRSPSVSAAAVRCAALLLLNSRPAALCVLLAAQCRLAGSLHHRQCSRPTARHPQARAGAAPRLPLLPAQAGTVAEVAARTASRRSASWQALRWLCCLLGSKCAWAPAPPPTRQQRPRLHPQASSHAASVCATSGDAFCFSKAQSDALAKCFGRRR